MPVGDSISKKISKSKETDKPLKRIIPLKWHKVKFEKPSGLNIGLIGEPKAGRTTLALLFAYFNSEYKDLIKQDGYEYVVEALSTGLLPEIEEIIILEPENKLQSSIQRGVRKALVRPFVEKNILDIIPFPIERKEIELTEDSFSVKQNRIYFEERKQEFIATVLAIVEEFGENTLFIIDTLTHYRKLLDDRFGLLYDVLNKRDTPSMEGVDTYRQSYYASRNTSWDNVMNIKQSFEGWNIDVYKEKPIPAHYQQTGEDPYTILWVPGTMHFLNIAYRIYEKNDRSREIEIYKGEYVPEKAEDCYLGYPLRTKMGAMPILDSLCKELILGEKGVK